ncbi:DUF3761 domain-containing protein [Actinomycetospora endophytica]|uniref:DUF3761 domain-containing protein n=1 Tax=Actinomycetospora endophytica TaxID=2291215 RepID=A0ABS8P352_9PSEU|nr:DUF3761 domain-containing protein [Actinomycetospora endophytica]MCD2192666.1 DUF3761 domain-containing protein [Actinomycetospora endophytica]
MTATSDAAAARRSGRWARIGICIAGLGLLTGVAACTPTTEVPTSSSSSVPVVAPTTTTTPYGSSTYGSSTYGSSSSGSSTYGSSTYSSSGSYDSSSSSGSSSSSSSSGDSSSSSGASGSPYAGTYTNSDGQQVERPDANSSGATARCKDGTDSHSKHKSGTCSGHGGVSEWL